jgi:acyl dehydratase
MESMWYDDVEVGQQWTSQSRTVLESDVSQFAGMTGDFNPLHVDHDYAASSPYRKPIAHGLLGLSWVAGLGSTAPLMETVAFTSIKGWNFLLPIYFGDTVRVQTRCCEKIPRGRKAGQILWERKLINQKGQVVQEGRFVTLVAIRQQNGVEENGTSDLADLAGLESKSSSGNASAGKPNLLKTPAVKLKSNAADS